MIAKILIAGLMTLLLLCAGMGLLVVVYLWLVWYVSRHDRRSVAEGKVAKPQGLSEADLRRLPTVECPMTEGGGGGGGDGAAAAVVGPECVVCLEVFESGERCRLIPTCGHSFHVQCADTWLSQRAVCPVCRRSAYEDLNNNNSNNNNSCSNVENAVALQEGEGAVAALDGTMIVIEVNSADRPRC